MSSMQRTWQRAIWRAKLGPCRRLIRQRREDLRELRQKALSRSIAKWVRGTAAIAVLAFLSACVLDWTPPDLGDDATTDDQIIGDDVVGDAAICSGVVVLGACWTLAADGESCSSSCAPRGGYDAATATIAGSSGTDEACGMVLDALGVPAGPVATVGTANGAGCFFNLASSVRYRIATTPTTAEASAAYWRRACACGG